MAGRRAASPAARATGKRPSAVGERAQSPTETMAHGNVQSPARARQRPKAAAGAAKAAKAAARADAPAPAAPAVAAAPALAAAPARAPAPSPLSWLFLAIQALLLVAAVGSYYVISTGLADDALVITRGLLARVAARAARAYAFAAAAATGAPLPPAPAPQAAPGPPLPFGLWWFAPFFAGGGYCSEATAFVLALAQHPALSAPGGGRVHVTLHGDSFQQSVFQGLPEATRVPLMRMQRQATGGPRGAGGGPRLRDVIVCHSEPGAWSAPRALFSTPPCPPEGLGGPQLFTIGRTMFESDRLSAEHVRRCNLMDEVWVPTAFHVETFASSGVSRDKLVVVPEPIDTGFFDPEKVSAVALPVGRQVFGGPRPAEGAAGAAGDAGAPASVAGPAAAPAFTWFLSVFKWEDRKGWDVLLEAYLREFDGSDDVGLVLLTNPYHGAADFAEQMAAFAAARGLTSPDGRLKAAPPGEPARAARPAPPRVWVHGEHVSDAALAGLYRGATAFVLPSRGEGWGRPHVEAMAMGLPVIATNWSGPTAFMTEANSYPLPITGLEALPQDGPWAGHQWASPSMERLRELLRRVTERPEEARAKGARARADMLARYQPAVVADLVVKQLRTIEERLRAKGAIRDPTPEEAARARARRAQEEERTRERQRGGGRRGRARGRGHGPPHGDL